MSTRRIVFIGLCSFLLLVILVGAEIPDYIKVCKKNDPKLAACINNSIEFLKPKLKEGLPELNMPPLEPLHLDGFSLNTGPESIRFNANVTDITVYGAANFVIEKLVPKVEKNTYMFRVNLPYLYYVGEYEIDVQFMLLRMQGSGPFTGNMTNYRFDCVMKGHRIKRDGKEYLEFDKMHIRIQLGHSYLNLMNLFNGDPVLGKATNDMINDSSDLFINSIIPPLEVALGNKFNEMANKITTKFTTEELFP